MRSAVPHLAISRHTVLNDERVCYAQQDKRCDVGTTRSAAQRSVRAHALTLFAPRRRFFGSLLLLYGTRRGNGRSTTHTHTHTQYAVRVITCCQKQRRPPAPFHTHSYIVNGTTRHICARPALCRVLLCSLCTSQLVRSAWLAPLRMKGGQI